MSDRPSCPAVTPGKRPGARSLRRWRECLAPPEALPTKPDRMLIGAVADVALPDLLGRASTFDCRGLSARP